MKWQTSKNNHAFDFRPKCFPFSAITLCLYFRLGKLISNKIIYPRCTGILQDMCNKVASNDRVTKPNIHSTDSFNVSFYPLS